MAETGKLSLPLIAAAQAQKHVTVNEALTRLDGLVQLRLTTVGQAAPPGAPAEGEVHAVGSGATGDWVGEDGRLALFVNGGWVFLTPDVGWRGWLEAEGTTAVFDGAAWSAGVGAVSLNGAAFVQRTVEVDHSVSSGSVSTVSGALPQDSVVYGVTGRVLSAIGGAASFKIGVAGSDNRYGSGFGTAAGSWTRGLTGTPLAYYSDEDLILSAEGGAFDGTGSVRLAVHFAELTLPRA